MSGTASSPRPPSVTTPKPRRPATPPATPSRSGTPRLGGGGGGGATPRLAGGGAGVGLGVGLAADEGGSIGSSGSMMGGGGSGGFESSGGLGTTFSPSSSSSYAPPPADGSSSAPRAFAYSSDRGIVVEPAAIPAAIRSLVLRLWLFGRHALYSLTSLVRLQRRGGASRAVALGVTLLLALATLSLFSLAGYRPFFLPPSYAEESHRETYLPQVHPATQTPAERSPHARYVAFAPIKETGFNYQLQSLIIQQVVAFESNRSLAFEPYHVVDSILPVSLLRWPVRSSRIPMSALLYSISNGFERLYSRRRAVPLKHFKRSCPLPALRHVDLSTNLHDTTTKHVGLVAFEHMTKTLADPQLGPCVTIDTNPFHREFFESQAPVDLYEFLADSPVLKQFAFSPRVLAIINRSVKMLSPSAASYVVEPEVSKQTVRHKPWRNVLALHLRKSTDKKYCEKLGERSAPFVGFNKLPSLPGNENVPPPVDMVHATRMGLYRAKCDPSTLEIIARARRMRRNHPWLDTIYILSDGGDEAFIGETRRWLESEGWHKVLTSADVINEPEDYEVGEAVDTEIARRSGVFVGNGFSALSSNVALLRTRDGRPRDYTQYW